MRRGQFMRREQQSGRPQKRSPYLCFVESARRVSRLGDASPGGATESSPGRREAEPWVKRAATAEPPKGPTEALAASNSSHSYPMTNTSV